MAVGITPAQATDYRVVHGWPILPDGEVLGSVAGFGVDSHGNVFVFHRAGRTWPDSDVLELTPIAHPTVDVFDGRTGALLTRWGANLFAMPHGLAIDDHDNVWLTDVIAVDVNGVIYVGDIKGARVQKFVRDTVPADKGPSDGRVGGAYVPNESENAALKDAKIRPELLDFCKRFASCWISLWPGYEKWIVVRACDEAHPIGNELLLLFTPEGAFDHVSHGL